MENLWGILRMERHDAICISERSLWLQCGGHWDKMALRQPRQNEGLDWQSGIWDNTETLGRRHWGNRSIAVWLDFKVVEKKMEKPHNWQAKSKTEVKWTKQRQVLIWAVKSMDDTLVCGYAELEVLVEHPCGLGRDGFTRICRIRIGKARNGTLRETNADGTSRGRWVPWQKLMNSKKDKRKSRS